MAGNKQCIGVIGSAMNDTDWDRMPGLCEFRDEGCDSVRAVRRFWLAVHS